MTCSQLLSLYSMKDIALTTCIDLGTSTVISLGISLLDIYEDKE